MYFSIVIPTYNRASIISYAIYSVLNQTFNDYEVIIVDDGSSDNTEQIIKSISDKRIKYIKTENYGVAHARNIGIKQAIGTYIGFLDSDDLMENYHMQTAYEFIQQNNNPEVVHLNFQWGDRDRSVIHKNLLPKKSPDDIFKSCSLHVNCTFIKNETAKKNLFNESRELMFAEDWDFFIKLAIRYPISYLDKVTSYLVDHEDRSMRNFEEKKWITRRDAITRSLSQDDIFSKKYESKIRIVTAHMNSLIAINFAVRKNKKKCLYFLFLALNQNILELFTKRSAAIVKHLIFSW